MCHFLQVENRGCQAGGVPVRRLGCGGLLRFGGQKPSRTTPGVSMTWEVTDRRQRLNDDEPERPVPAPAEARVAE